jgi:hypothetical protein
MPVSKNFHTDLQLGSNLVHSNSLQSVTNVKFLPHHIISASFTSSHFPRKQNSRQLGTVKSTAFLAPITYLCPILQLAKGNKKQLQKLHPSFFNLLHLSFFFITKDLLKLK